MQQNSATHLNRARIISARFKQQHRASWLELTFTHATTKQSCEIQWEALEFSEEHKDWYKPVSVNWYKLV